MTRTAPRSPNMMRLPRSRHRSPRRS